MKRKDLIDENFARGALKIASKANPSTLSTLTKYGKAGLSGLGKAADVVKYPFQNKLKTAAGATAGFTGYEYLKDPDAPIGTLVARGVKDVGDVTGKVLGWAAEKGGKLARDFAKGWEEPSDKTTDVAGGNKTKQPSKPEEPQAAKPSDDGVQPLPTRGIGFDELRERNLNKVLNKYELFLNEESEQEKKYRETREKLQRGIYGQESGYGKARTDKPNYAGALGPMQIMPGTFNGMKKSGLIPKDYDINNPEHNRAAGNALIAHYYDKYQGDPAKVAAAYYAGPKAVNKDGTINTHYRDRKNPKAPNVGKYIDDVVGRAGIKDVTYTAAKPSAFKIPSVAAATPAVTDIDQPGTKLEPKAPIPTTTAASADVWKDVPLGGLPKMDWEAFRLAAKRGEDTEDTSRFLIPSTKTAALSEKYEQFKIQEAEAKQGAVGAELAQTSGGQFATRADRLDQAKVDAALGPGFKAGSREANLALAQKFRTQQPDQSGQGAKPSATSALIAKPVLPTPSKFSSVADAAGLATLGTAGASLAKGAATPVLAKVGSAAAKALPVVGGAFMAADAARRYDLGDTTGAAISAAGVHPVLGLPAVGVQALRDKYRTGSFFPDDEEIKAASAPKLKEGSKTMNKKQLQKRLEKLEEAKAQLQEALGSFARAGAKYGGALKSKDFGKMLTGLGTDLKPPADVTRKAGQTFDRVRGTGSSGDAMAQNRRTGEVLPLGDIGKTGSKPPAVWRKGADAGAATTTTKAATTATKAAGAADDVAAAAAKGGKPLGRGTTAALAGLGGGAVGLGLGMMGKDDKPNPPTPPGPEPAPRPTPAIIGGRDSFTPQRPDKVKPSPEKPPYDIYQPRSDDSDNNDSSDYRRYKPIKDPDPIKPADDANDLADRYGPDSYVARTTQSADDNIDVKATADRDRISRMVNQTNESLDEILRLAGMSKK